MDLTFHRLGMRHYKMGDYSGHQQPLVAIEADWQPLYKRLDKEKGPGGCQRPMSLILYTCTSTKELAKGQVPV